MKFLFFRCVPVIEYQEEVFSFFFFQNVCLFMFMYIQVYSISYLFKYIVYFLLLLLLFFCNIMSLAAVANKFPCLWDNKGILILILIFCTWVEAAGRWICHLWLLLLLLLLLWILQATSGPLLITDSCNSSSAQGLVASLLPLTLAETHQRNRTKHQADCKHHCCADDLEYQRPEV